MIHVTSSSRRVSRNGIREPRSRIRAGSLAGATFAVLVALPAVTFGQKPPAAVDVLKSEIDAVIAAPDGGTDRQIKVVDIGKLNVGVGVLTQPKKLDDGKPITGILHAQVSEVYYVLSGSGVLITGTEVADPASLPANSDVVRVAVGPSSRATFMGGARRTVSVGDVVVIPAGVLHGWVEIPDHVRYLSVRPDPDRVLPAGYVNPALQQPAP
jgi:mannose-6-phosphate isomerase-like protein (cupin superfamily)